MIQIAILLLLGFILVHMCKMLRLYLVLMEHQISFGKFVLMYIRTTFVNLIIPFKFGEIYRFISISRLTGVWQVGILSIFLDRFFDIIALLMILIPIDMLTSGGLSLFATILLFVVVVTALVYLCVKPSYTYLNHYIIMKKKSKRALVALKGLDVIHEWYQFTNKLISGRSILIILASLGGWICEALLLKGFSQFVLNMQFGLASYGDYIRSIFAPKGNVLLLGYTKVGALLLLVTTIVTHVIYIIVIALKRRTDK